MKLKLNEAGHVVVSDGKPVYIDSEGKEIVHDAADALRLIASRNFEAKTNRERAEAAEAKLKAFDGLDASEARKALDTLTNIDRKKLIDAGEVDKVRKEVATTYEAQLKAEKEAREKIEGALYSEMIGGAFARSKFLSEKSAVPSDMIQAAFGRNFTITDGKMVAKDATGNTILSRSRIGEPADFEEAIESLVMSYPHKDMILKGSGAQGQGARPGAANGNGSAKSMSRAQFDALDASARMQATRGGITLTD